MRHSAGTNSPTSVHKPNASIKPGAFQIGSSVRLGPGHAPHLQAPQADGDIHAITCIVEVQPAPFCPQRPMTFPLEISNSTPSTAKSPRRFVRSEANTIGLGSAPVRGLSLPRWAEVVA